MQLYKLPIYFNIISNPDLSLQLLNIRPYKKNNFLFPKNNNSAKQFE